MQAGGNLHVTIEMHILQVAIELRALFHVDITHKLVPTAFCTRNNRPVFCKAFIFNCPCSSISTLLTTVILNVGFRAFRTKPNQTYLTYLPDKST